MLILLVACDFSVKVLWFLAMEPASYKKLLLSSWNVCGLGDSDKCRDVRCTLSSTPLHVICLQETKLSDIAISKASSFLPSGLTNFTYKNSNGASGGGSLMLGLVIWYVTLNIFVWISRLHLSLSLLWTAFLLLLRMSRALVVMIKRRISSMSSGSSQPPAPDLG